MPRISKNDVNNALTIAAQNIKDAAGTDGIASRRDLTDKLAGIESRNERDLTDMFFRFTDHRDHVAGARITAPDVDRSLEYAKEKLVKAYDVNNNGLSANEIGRMSRTGQLAVRLAAELKGVELPTIPKPTGPLADAVREAAKDTYYISESDSQPEFIQASFPASRALTGDNIVNAFKDHLASQYDQQDGDLSAYTYELQTGAEAKGFLRGLAEVRVEDDDYYKEMAAGFGRIKDVLEGSLTDLTVMRFGPKEDGTNALAVDQGAYQYLVVGRTIDGKLAGVTFESVET